MSLHYANPIKRLIALTAAQTDVFEFHVPGPMTLKAVHLVSGMSVATADAVFDVHKNGTTIFPTQSERPKIVVGAAQGSATRAGACVRGDRITVDLDSVHSSGVGGPLTVAFEFDDWDSYPDSPPATASAQDDEFNSSTLDSKWSIIVNSASSYDINTSWPSRLRASLSNGHFAISQSYSAASDFSVTACLHHSLRANQQGAYIYLVNSAFTNAIRLNVAFTSSRTIALSSLSSGTWSFDALSESIEKFNKLYLHLQRAGGALWSAYYSFDGFSWFRIGANNYTNTFTVETLRLDVFSLTTTEPVRAGWNWIRRDWLTL